MGEVVRVNSMGWLEGVDEDTGEVLWVEKKKPLVDPSRPRKVGAPKGRPKVKDPSPTHVVLDGNGRKITVPKGTDPSVLPHTVWPYNHVTTEHICNLVSQGKTLAEIGLMEGFPTANVIQSWLRKYPEFRREMKVAREMRAEHFHDEIVALVDSAKETTAKRDRLKFDALKWAASVNDPETFGNQTKVTGAGGGAVQIVIETGVRLAGDVASHDPPAIETSSTPLEDEAE